MQQSFRMGAQGRYQASQGRRVMESDRPGHHCPPEHLFQAELSLETGRQGPSGWLMWWNDCSLVSLGYGVGVGTLLFSGHSTGHRITMYVDVIATDSISHCKTRIGLIYIVPLLIPRLSGRSKRPFKSRCPAMGRSIFARRDHNSTDRSC